jgi:hypothetical protein
VVTTEKQAHSDDAQQGMSVEERHSLHAVPAGVVAATNLELQSKKASTDTREARADSVRKAEIDGHQAQARPEPNGNDLQERLDLAENGHAGQLQHQADSRKGSSRDYRDEPRVPLINRQEQLRQTGNDMADRMDLAIGDTGIGGWQAGVRSGLGGSGSDLHADDARGERRPSIHTPDSVPVGDILALQRRCDEAQGQSAAQRAACFRAASRGSSYRFVVRAPAAEWVVC